MSPVKVFISYASEDASSAHKLYDCLKEAGVLPWLDRESLLPGQKWRVHIKREIESSDYFIALLSTKSVDKRGYVQKELKQALDLLDEYPESEIFVIPVRLEECLPTHEKVKDLHWVDLFPSLNAGVEKILRVVSTGSGTRGYKTKNPDDYLNNVREQTEPSLTSALPQTASSSAQSPTSKNDLAPMPEASSMNRPSPTPLIKSVKKSNLRAWFCACLIALIFICGLITFSIKSASLLEYVRLSNSPAESDTGPIKVAEVEQPSAATSKGMPEGSPVNTEHLTKRVTLDIDPMTGLIAMPSCPLSRTRSFVIGHEPSRYCGPSYHGASDADRPIKEEVAVVIIKDYRLYHHLNVQTLTVNNGAVTIASDNNAEPLDQKGVELAIRLIGEIRGVRSVAILPPYE
jgi:hypothetical protein